MFLRGSILLFTFYLLLFSPVKGQHADCDDLKLITDTFYHAKNVVGYGNKKEFSGNSLESKLRFEEERNAIWYLLRMPAKGKLTFDIIAEDENDDWDFLLYEHKSMFCKRLEDNNIQPVRSNLSRSAVTGLSETSDSNFSVAGLNDNYSKEVFAEEGDEFVLVVNNPKKSGASHQLIVHYPKKEIVEEASKEEVKITPTVPKIVYSLFLKDKETGERVSSSVNITGLKRSVVELDHITDYEALLSKKSYNLIIDVAAVGYMLVSVPCTIHKGDNEKTMEVLLEKVKAGSRANLKNIQFYPGNANVLPKASGSVASLLEFMKLNKNITIEIEGHVNGPYMRNKREFQELSESRAKAIREFLIKNGISAKRVSSVGYGNTKMLYPEPKTEQEEIANRRVEILIKTIK